MGKNNAVEVDTSQVTHVTGDNDRGCGHSVMSKCSNNHQNSLLFVRSTCVYLRMF